MVLLLKRTMKITLTSIFLLLGLMPTAHAADKILYPADKWEVNQTWTWSYDEASKTLEFSGSGDIYTGYSPLSSPSYVHNYVNLFPWTYLRDKAEHLIIGEGITGIGNTCFSQFSQLKSISFPNTLTSIDDYAFGSEYASDSDGWAVTSIVFPPNLKTIGRRAFEGRFKITDISLPYGLKKIREKAFYCCSSIKEVTIPGTVWEMEAGIFWGCSSLEKVAFPEGIVVIPREMFYYCGFKSIEIPATVKKIEKEAFHGCKDLCEIKMSNGMKIIENSAFAETAITEIVFPDTVKTLGSGAVAQCYRLKKVTLPARLIMVHCDLFYGCKNLKHIELPKTVKYVRMSAFWGAGITKLVLPKNVVSITEIGDDEGYEYGMRGSSFSSYYRTRKIKLKNVKQIVIQSSKLERVSKKSFSGIKKTCVIKVPKRKVKKYKKMIYKSGVDKKVKIRAIANSK